jgi:ribose transport system substrate-binding protein
MQSTAKTLGLQYSIWPNQGQPSEWAQGINSAINRKISSVDLLAGINPAILGPQISAAKKAGIGTVASHLYNVGQKPAPNLAGTVDIPYEQAGRLLADYSIFKTGAKADALVITINEVSSTESMVRGIRSEFTNHCGAACKLSFINVSIPDIATRIQPQVQTALIGDPKINYIIALYDSAEAPFAVAGINAAGAANRVKVVTFNGTPSVMKMVRDGSPIVMDIGENLDWIARGILDQHMRLMAGLPPVKNEQIPLRVFDKSNIPSQDAPSFGTAYIAGYNKLWSLSK